MNRRASSKRKQKNKKPNTRTHTQRYTGVERKEKKCPLCVREWRWFDLQDETPSGSSSSCLIQKTRRTNFLKQQQSFFRRYIMLSRCCFFFLASIAILQVMASFDVQKSPVTNNVMRQVYVVRNSCWDVRQRNPTIFFILIVFIAFFSW